MNRNTKVEYKQNQLVFCLKKKRETKKNNAEKSFIICTFRQVVG